jgi:hypothetical protein
MKNIHKINQHTYITSDEEIKEGDWCLDSSETIVVKCLRTGSDSYWNKNCKKIILTTDQDLIKDGVQIVKGVGIESFNNGYKIIIPKEEQDKKLYSEEDLDMLRKFMIQEQNFSKSCLDIFIEQFKKK